jgi:hypothetical protein
MKRRLLLLLVSLVWIWMTAACAPRVPTIEMGPDAEITHDGLHLVKHSRRLQRVWVKPDFDLSGYSKILPVSAGIHYKRTPKKVRGEWPLTEAETTFVEEGLRDALQEELERKGNWEFVTTRGADVLLVRGAIIDLVVTAPSQEVGRNTSYSKSIGRATLVIELFDSESLEILARVADRREISHADGSWRNDPISNRAAARQAFRNWARRLAQGLEYARTVDLPTGAPTDQPPADAESTGASDDPSG